ncbi:NUDIX hydrolase [Nocardia brasiliensis]|uniref:NUDIX hydrolase n=1 Tax=Nocardia brasiliensis TaxID=37326 RepID=UPI0024587684|nr:NUDIX hydrolase [Nocardia brasiliensis]
MTTIDPDDTTEPETARLAADVVMLTERNGQLYVLLIERGNDPFQGRWAIPGGRVNRGEECEDAARRELREETGLEAVRLERVDVYSKVGRDPRDRYVSFAYVAKLDHMPAPVAGDDARAARWFPAAEILGQPERLAFDHAKILGDAIAHIHRGGTHTVSMNVGGNAHVGQVIGFSFGQGRP